MIKKIMILGASGSIGQSAIRIIKENPDRYRLTLATAHTNTTSLEKIKSIFPEASTILTSELKDSREWNRIMAEDSADIVLNGITGAAGLNPTLAALKTSKDLALANKESMVMAGNIVQQTAKENNCRIIPVDSEHSALFFLLQNRKTEDIKELVLTASGGPFIHRPLNEMKNVTLKEALHHPNWSMGPKITIDSATMANKGLEVIEAQRLFHLPQKCIKVVIHPQSYIHSLIRTIDGALYAQISLPDMRLPIQNSFSYPEYHQVSGIDLELEGKHMDFLAPDPEKYPLLKLSYQALEAGEGYTVAYNASNEVAVDAFVKEHIRFIDIAGITEEILQKTFPAQMDSVETVMEIDRKARLLAEEVIQRKK